MRGPETGQAAAQIDLDAQVMPPVVVNLAFFLKSSVASNFGVLTPGIVPSYLILF